jgi:RND family efflux transporter MFP subunit
MKKIFPLITIVSLSFWLMACGGNAETNKELAKKKASLEKLRAEQKQVNDKIAALEKEIAKLDPSIAAGKAKLVSLETIASDTFQHYIDLQGRVDAQQMAMVVPRGQGGIVRSIHVRAGQRVSKGQLILKLDDLAARQQVDAIAAQIPGLESAAKLAQSVYDRQSNLWKNNIGTEVQVLQAKTNAENAEAQLKAAKANLEVAKETASLANVYAEISGMVDIMNVKIGDYFTVASAMNPQSGARIVSNGAYKVMVQVPENYLGRINTGSPVRIVLPELNNKVVNSKLSVVSNVVDPVSRTFTAEAQLPSSADIRPNQLAKVQMQDYVNNKAITIPINTLQSDEQGKFVLVAAKNEENKMIARKKIVEMGEMYGDRVEILSGLQAGDQIVVGGYQSLYDGQLITTAK